MAYALRVRVSPSAFSPGPGLGYSVIGSLGSGTGVYLTAERVYRSGYTWGHLTRGGWVATNHLMVPV